MNPNEALQLFCQKAFGRSEPQEDLLELSKIVCDYAGGLPLALSILGSFFHGRSTVQWEDALDMLKKEPPKDIFRTLKISFDALTDTEQTIFLDIACFFNGWSKNKITKILESYGFNAKIGITTLQEKSMLKNYDNILVMHDLVEQMGRKIVVDKSSNYIGNRSRLWTNEDIDKVMENNLCSKNLKILDLRYSKNLIETPDFLELPNLERLELEGCEKLVDLHISIGQLKKLQALNLKGCKNLRARCPKKLEMTALKELVFCGCIQVKFLPEFGESMKNLETIDVGETNIVRLPESLGLLIGLKTLKLRGCKNLVCLPQSIHNLKRLVVIDISGCSKFSRLPEKLNEIEGLEELNASETDITEIPPSIGGLEKLKKLSVHGCKRSISNYWSMILLWKHMFWGRSVYKRLTLPASMFNLKSLTELDLSFYGIDDGSIPDDLSGLSSLKRLDLSGNNFKNLPTGCISNLLNLNSVMLNSCSELQLLPQTPPSLCFMEAEECPSLEIVGGEQLSHLFATMDQGEDTWMNENLSVTIPGSEIPSWFENQVDLCTDEEGRAFLSMDIPPWEEMVGIGLCTLLESKFYSTEPDTRERCFLWWLCDCYGNSRTTKYLRAFDCDGEKKRKSPHLWVVFWKQREVNSAMMELRERSQIPFIFNAGCNDAKVTIRCGWRVMRKGDFENSGCSTNQSFIPILEQQMDRRK
ncbi:disease resistance protein RPP2A-like [Neltuma alba]|uniref:disease resistance protein RPP2A-like n=1 Tax=Neltuma alba TaxID=207710 RepID=UPI0010A4F0F2|nr:disease resistance protein RPP2A-like [Prosopis alba]